jgi:hypothetical protein
MIYIQNQLLNLFALPYYINDCPKSCQKTILAEEIGYRTRLKNAEKPSYSDIALRWLIFQCKARKEKDPTRIKEYTSAFCQCASFKVDFIKNFAIKYQLEVEEEIENENKIINEEKLNQLIPQQQEAIFSKCLSEQTLHYLNCMGQGKEKLEFSVEDIINATILDYKNKLYREALLQFEIISLIERYAFLLNKRERAKFDRGWEMMTMSTSVFPELGFVQKKLDISNLEDFRLESMRKLFFHLGGLTDLGKLTKEGFLDGFDKFISTKGQENIDPDIGQEDFIGERQINYYFNSKKREFTTLSNYMSEFIETTDQFIKTVKKHIHNPSIFDATLTTEDRGLLELRKTVSAYRMYLGEIEQKERKAYVNRHDEALSNRRLALLTLERCIHRVDSVRAETKQAVKTLVFNIKENKPRWSELSFIDKILDIVTLGMRVVYRYVKFEQNESATRLENLKYHPLLK